MAWNHLTQLCPVVIFGAKGNEHLVSTLGREFLALLTSLSFAILVFCMGTFLETEICSYYREYITIISIHDPGPMIECRPRE
jgi:hypothetical protein